MRNVGGLDEGDKDGDGKKWSHSGYNLKVYLRGLVDGLIRGMSKRPENLEGWGWYCWNDQDCRMNRLGG